MNWQDYYQLLLAGSVIVGTLVGTGWLAAMWLNKKFGEVHDNIDKNVSDLEKNIVQKLEYHERHDDDRFAEIRNSIWEIRLRNAAKDGLTPPIHEFRSSTKP